MLFPGRRPAWWLAMKTSLKQRRRCLCGVRCCYGEPVDCLPMVGGVRGVMARAPLSGGLWFFFIIISSLLGFIISSLLDYEKRGSPFLMKQRWRSGAALLRE